MGAADDRRHMVERQLRARGIHNERLLEVMATIPRERFVAQGSERRAYHDEALPIDQGQTISQPYIVAEMTELIDPHPGDWILELGTGSGYQAAILAAMGARVLTIERHPTLAMQARERLDALADGVGRRVEIRVGDGSLGASDRAPYDGILVTAAAPAIPVELRDQLATTGGRLVIPIGPRDQQILMLVHRDGNDWSETPHGRCVFVPLIGAGGFAGDPS